MALRHNRRRQLKVALLGHGGQVLGHRRQAARAAGVMALARGVGRTLANERPSLLLQALHGCAAGGRELKPLMHQTASQKALSLSRSLEAPVARIGAVQHDAGHVMVYTIGARGAGLRVASRASASTPGHIDDWRGRARDPPLRHVALPFGRGLSIQLGLPYSALSVTLQMAVFKRGAGRLGKPQWSSFCTPMHVGQHNLMGRTHACGRTQFVGLTTSTPLLMRDARSWGGRPARFLAAYSFNAFLNRGRTFMGRSPSQVCVPAVMLRTSEAAA